MIPKNKVLTEQEAQELRLAAVLAFDIKEFTCDDCGARFSCPCAFDAYNTDGDCLMEK